jgi:hypothetical protein
MIMVGTNIMSNADKLIKTQEEYIYNSLRNPKPVIESKIRQLRIVYSMNPKQYSQLKRSLPYFVCGIFNPPFRRIENFAYIDHFMIDIDNIAEKGMDINELRTKIQNDERVIMCFTSPSEDGLKVMFELKERCFDYGIYSIFYKEFIRVFSSQYQLEQVIDVRTSDVSRACFISIDANVYYNPAPQTVDINKFINLENTSELFDLKHEQDNRAIEYQKEVIKDTNASHNPDPDKEIMKAIKDKLNPKSVSKDYKDAYVPQLLDDIIEDLKKYIEATGIIVCGTKNIQYAKKIQCKLGLKMSEINVFYGKRGFSVVKSPKCGTNEELNDLVADLINAFLNEYEQ